MTCIFKNVGLRLLLFQECFLELYVSIFCSIILAFFLGNSNYVHLISFVFLVYLTIPFNHFFLTPLFSFYTRDPFLYDLQCLCCLVLLPICLHFCVFLFFLLFSWFANVHFIVSCFLTTLALKSCVFALGLLS